MDAAEASTRTDQSPFDGVDRWLEGILGSDMRLIYGVVVPMVFVVDLIVLLTIKPSWAIVGVIMVVEFAALALVVFALLKMLSEGEDEDPDNPWMPAAEHADH